MEPIARIELPSLLAQSQHVARLGGARPGQPERVERQEEHDRLVRLSEQRSEEVQAAERVAGVGAPAGAPRGGGAGGGPGRPGASPGGATGGSGAAAGAGGAPITPASRRTSRSPVTTTSTSWT